MAIDHTNKHVVHVDADHPMSITLVSISLPHATMIGCDSYIVKDHQKDRSY